jgi:hypothetical protein
VIEIIVIVDYSTIISYWVIVTIVDLSYIEYNINHFTIVNSKLDLFTRSWFPESLSAVYY